MVTSQQIALWNLFPCSSPFLSSTGDEGWASRGEQEEMAPSLACLSEAAAFLVLSEEQIAYLTHGHVSVSIWCPTHSGALGLYVGPWRYPACLPASHLVPAPCQSGSSHTHPDHQQAPGGGPLCGGHAEFRQLFLWAGPLQKQRALHAEVRCGCYDLGFVDTLAQFLSP